MKKFFTLLLLVLAMNFLAAAGGIGWLVQTGHLTKGRMKSVRELLFPPEQAAAVPATKPSADSASTRPILRLDDLMAQQAGRPISEQVDFIRRTFDQQMLELDQKRRELDDLKRQVDLANEQLATDRKALEKSQTELAAKEQEQNRLQNDKGFQDSLALYSTLPSKQVKTIFMTLSEQTVEQYLDAMPPRTAGKIMKEFNKTPEETAFIQHVLERMRSASATTESSSAAANTAADTQAPAALANGK